jgi:proline iminopeptidase
MYLRMPLLEERARVVYVDPIGCGDSASLDEPSAYGRTRDVADLEGIRKHLGLDRIALLGHSSGGFVVQQYAIQHPAHVERMVLFDTSPTNGADFNVSLKAEMQARAGKPWFSTASAAMNAFFTRDVTQEESHLLFKDVLPLYSYDADPSVTARLADVTRLNVVRFQKAPSVAFDFRSQLSSLRIPTLIIVGAGDFICAPALAKMLHASIPGSRLVVMERSGHMAHLEEPAAFAATVASFLRS